MQNNWKKFLNKSKRNFGRKNPKQKYMFAGTEFEYPHSQYGLASILKFDDF